MSCTEIVLDATVSETAGGINLTAGALTEARVELCCHLLVAQRTAPH